MSELIVEENKSVASNKELSDLEANDSSSSSDLDSQFNYISNNNYAQKSNGIKGRAKNILKNKKGLLILGSIGGLAIGMIIWLIMILLGTLLIPQIMQEITGYQFARITSEFADNAQRITDEKLAVEIEANNPKVFNSIEDEFATSSEDATSLWDKMLNQFSVTKAISNLKTNNGLSLNYETSTILNRPVLKSIVLNSKIYEVEAQGFTKYIPVVGSLVKFGQDFNFSQDFASSLNESLRANDVGLIARSAAASEFRQQAGIGLVAWSTARLTDYLGKDSNQARILEDEDQVGAINKSLTPDPAKTDEINNAENAVSNAETTAEKDPNAITSAVNNGGIPPSVENALNSSLASSGISDIVGAVNPIYKVAIPLCIVYDGSLDKSGTTIDNGTRQQASAFYYMAAASDQEKYGSPGVNAEAVGALNNSINAPNSSGQYTILSSNPEIRANGGSVDTSQSNISGEASAQGEYTLLNVLFGSNTITSVVETFANYTCPYLTNLYTGIGLGVINLLLVFGPGAIEEGTIDAASGTALADINAEATGGAISNLLSNTLNVGSRVGKMLVGTAKSAGEITGATLAAKLIVMSKAAQVNNGFAQGSDLVNQADAGGNFVANEADQQGFYGQPLDDASVAQSNQATTVALAKQEGQKSFTQRYFALDDANSLLSRLAMDIYTHINGSFFASISSLVTKIFNPTTLFSDVFGSLGLKNSYAASSVSNSDYGNVQFGWTQSEESLINSNASYNPLENQNYLDTAPPIVVGKTLVPAEQFIQNMYGKCFTESIGTMLSSGDLIRDKQGSVIDNPYPNQPSKAICSPIYLGPNNPVYGSLVFRWRLAQAYNNTVTELSQISSLGS